MPEEECGSAVGKHSEATGAAPKKRVLVAKELKELKPRRHSPKKRDASNGEGKDSASKGTKRTGRSRKNLVDGLTRRQLKKLMHDLSLKELSSHAAEMIERLGENAVKGNVSCIRLLCQLADQCEELQQMSPEDCSSLLDKQITIGMELSQDPDENEQEREKA